MRDAGEGELRCRTLTYDLRTPPPIPSLRVNQPQRLSGAHDADASGESWVPDLTWRTFASRRR
jgi:hypothetical protein